MRSQSSIEARNHTDLDHSFKEVPFIYSMKQYNDIYFNPKRRNTPIFIQVSEKPQKAACGNKCLEKIMDREAQILHK
jgi:hypothetical protein